MKREQIRLAVTAAVLAFLTGTSAAGCLVTGFTLDAVPMGRVAVICAAAAALCSVLFSVRRGGIVLLCGAALACGYLWRDGTIYIQLPQLLNQLTQRYHFAYGFPLIDPSQAGESTAVGYPVALIGVLAVIGVSGVVCRRKSTLFALPAALLPLIACLVCTDTVPAERYLFGIILGITLLVMTSWTRRRGGDTGARLIALLALPLAAALAALFLAVPQEGYVPPDGTLQERAEAVIQRMEERLGGTPQGVGFSGTSGSRVDLRSAGKRTLSKQKVMRVTAQQGGTLYLRGRDYDRYTGTGWESTGSRSEIFSRGSGDGGTVTVETYGARPWRYVPYYAAQELVFSDGCLPNDGDAERYTYRVCATPQGLPYQYVAARYLELPEETKLWAVQLADEIVLSATAQTTSEKADAIADFVRGSAVYDLDTRRMPSGCHDFAEWFLMESDTGYCVHYATATVVLLRAVGIPARYVEGYMAPCAPGAETVVTGESAHAWAEYYDRAEGVWRLRCRPLPQKTHAPPSLRPRRRRKPGRCRPSRRHGRHSPRRSPAGIRSRRSRSGPERPIRPERPPRRKDPSACPHG